MIAKIPLDQIEKATIYVNTGRKTMAQVKQALGCDYIINAGLFNMTTFKPMNHLVVGGKVLSKSLGKTGMSFNGSKIMLSYDNQVNYPDHVSGYPLLVASGKKQNYTTPSGLSGSRPRSVIGLTKDAFVMATFDGCTLSAATQTMLDNGCLSAINLDGGGSTQADFDGKRVTSSRIVHNYVCVWLKQDKPADDAPDWAQASWVKAKKAGVMDGTRPNDPPTRAELAVMFDRLGLL